MDRESSYIAGEKAMRLLKSRENNTFNIRVYFGRYISYFKNIEIFAQCDYGQRRCAFNIKWVDDKASVYSVSQMNLSSQYFSDTSKFTLEDNFLCIKDGISKIEIEI